MKTSTKLSGIKNIIFNKYKHISMGFTQYISNPFTKEEFKNNLDLIFNKTM